MNMYLKSLKKKSFISQRVESINFSPHSWLMANLLLKKPKKYVKKFGTISTQVRSTPTGNALTPRHSDKEAMPNVCPWLLSWESKGPITPSPPRALLYPYRTNSPPEPKRRPGNGAVQLGSGWE